MTTSTTASDACLDDTDPGDPTDDAGAADDARGAVESLADWLAPDDAPPSTRYAQLRAGGLTAAAASAAGVSAPAARGLAKTERPGAP